MARSDREQYNYQKLMLQAMKTDYYVCYKKYRIYWQILYVQEITAVKEETCFLPSWSFFLAEIISKYWFWSEDLL